MQRAGARSARRELIEEDPGVVLHLLQLLEDLDVFGHVDTLTKRRTGRSRRARKTASLIHDSAADRGF